jgi:predicted ArsR family transcriptional regulator
MRELAREGMVELVLHATSAPASRGRPTQVYRLAERETTSNYQNACSALLSASLDGLPGDPLQKAAAYLAGSITEQQSPTHRLNQSVHLLNQMAYRARWEAGATGPRILLRSCPYSTILPRHPELCLLDRFLLEYILKVPLEQTVKMDPITGRPPACVFIPKKP